MEPFDTTFLTKGLFQAFLQAFGWLFSAWYMWAFILLMIALRLGPHLYETWRLRKAGMPEIDRMTGLEFEKYLEILFSRLGYQVERTRYVGDQGGDLIITKGGERTLVQAKRHSKAIGNKAVQEAAAARPHYKCDRAVVVANQEFTRAAQELARSNHVELWGRRHLAEMVLSTTHTAQPAVTPVAASLAPSTTTGTSAAAQAAPTCQRCGRPMVERTSTRGKFWGCSGFPKCRNTAPIDRA